MPTRTKVGRGMGCATWLFIVAKGLFGLMPRKKEMHSGWREGADEAKGRGGEGEEGRVVRGTFLFVM